MKPEHPSATSWLVLAVTCAFALLILATPSAPAQTFSVVHNFTGGSDGGYPMNGFTTNGTALFGTTSSGGTSGLGVVFKISTTGTETVLHTFTGGADGASPNAGVIRNKSGYLFGTTTAGGASGVGTVFEVIGKKESVLYSFAGGKDGAVPDAGLVLDAAGNLYGTTSGGGASGNGTVFKLAAPATAGGQWTESVLYSFGTGTDGSVPVGGVSLDSAGNLYGTTSTGGAYGSGTVFQLKPGTPWTENILHNFQNADDGATPYAGLIPGKSGVFYGAATDGGTGGGGTIFELTPDNGNWTFTVLYSVPGWGISGSFRNLVRDAKGNLYGTTHCDGGYSAGTVYELTPSSGTWNYTLLYTFTGGSDGLYSFSNLVLNQGHLYGTTAYGGSQNAGVVFEVIP
ncbi:MAG TPA: choice-of-anchor tandem repeat GloVer-containing protein [Terriglobales bacterium]|nr:choice-of-anchor tandem repeat GloVer-containing protein [Terriglobales bacterium]